MVVCNRRKDATTNTCVRGDTGRPAAGCDATPSGREALSVSPVCCIVQSEAADLILGGMTRRLKNRNNCPGRHQLHAKPKVPNRELDAAGSGNRDEKYPDSFLKKIPAR